MAIYKSINSKNALSTHGGMRNCLNYILNPQKTDAEHCYVSGVYNDSSITAEKVYQNFLDIKRQYNADIGRQYAHSVISFHKDEEITPEQALSFAIDFCEKVYDGHQVAIAVHNDKDHIHCHLVINTVNYIDGSKLHKSKDDLQADKDICNELCKDYGLTVAEKGKHFDGTEFEEGEITSWSKDTYNLLADSKKKSYLADCGIAFMTAMDKSHSKADFINAMVSQGWQVDWKDNKKHIVFKNADGKKVRGNNLVKTFKLPATKELIISELERKSRIAKSTEDKRLSENATIGSRKSTPKNTSKGTIPKSKSRGR